MQVLGHRGSRCPGPENTLVAVREALRAGADGVEIDVRRSRDGALVCVHDPVVADRPVIETEVVDLRRVGVPSVEEVLDASRDRRVVLEVKNSRRQSDGDGRRDASAARLVALVERRLAAGTADSLVVSSFDPVAIAVVRNAGLASAQLTLPRVPIVAGLRVVVRGRHRELHAHISSLPARQPRRAAAAVSRVHEQGVRLVIWTVTATWDALRLRDAGVDAVICDDPAAVVRALAA